jgi:hypothetical protein
MADINSLTDEQLEQVALGKLTLDEAIGKTSYYTVDNIDELSDEQLAMVAAGTPLSEIQKERNEFVGMGSSIGGALGGAAIGTAILPGVGTAVGGIIGGALGAFGGELAEDELQGEDLNYANAAKEAAISVGLDVVTLGAMKFAKPAYFAGKRALGFTAEEVAQDLAQKAAVRKGIQTAGTQTSLAATQELLSKTGATLTPSQVGGDGILEFYENIGRGGIASGKLFDENMAKVNDAVSGAINDLVGKHQAGVALKGELGESVDNVLYEAKKSLGKQYEIGLREVEGLIKNDTVNVLPIYNALEGFLKSKRNKLGNSSLQKDALRVIEDIQKDLSGGFKLVDEVREVKTPYTNSFGQKMFKTEKQVVGKKKIPVPITAKQLIEWQKKVNKTVSDMKNPQSPLYATSSDAEISQAARALSGALDGVMAKVNPQAYAKYQQVKKAYSKGINVLRPDSVKGVINAASKGDYERLGKMFFQEGKVNINQFDQTWKAVKSAASLMDKKQLSNLGFSDKADLFKTIKESYVRNLFPDVNDVKFSITDYANKMAKLTPEEVKQARKILGKDYGRFNQIRNAIIDASKQSKTDVGLLSLRSKELQGISAIATASMTGIVGGLAAVLAPKMMAKIALNPKQTARLINIMKRSSDTPEGLTATQKAITALLASESVETATD